MNLFLVKNGVQCLLIKWSGCQTDYTEYVKTLSILFVTPDR